MISDRGELFSETEGNGGGMVVVLYNYKLNEMGLFKVNQPRGFQHNYMYYDPRKEKLKKIEEKAKRELGLLPEKEFDPEDIRGKFVGATKHLKRRKEGGKSLSSGFIILLIVVLCLVLRYLYTGYLFY